MPAPTESQQVRREQGPVTKRGETRKRDLLVAARRVFERQGFAGANVAAIVKEAKTSRGTFYTYFDTKEAIFAAVARQVVKDMLDMLATPIDTSDFDRRVHGAIRRFVAAYRPHARILGLMERVGTYSPEMADIRLEARQIFVLRTQRSFERMKKEGLTDADLDVVYAAETLGAMLEYTCYLWFCLGKDFDEDRLIDSLARTWLKVIGHPGSGV